MKNKFRRTLFIIMGYVFFLALTIPATQAYKYFHNRLPPIKVSSLTGSVWNATALNLQVGEFNFHKARIALRPIPLLAAKVSLKADLDSAFGSVKGIVNFNKNNSYQFKEFKTNLSAQTLAGIIGVRAKLLGNVYFDLKNITLIEGQLKQVTGIIQWKQAAIESPFKLKLGNIKILLKKHKKIITGIINNTNANTQLKGQIKVTNTKHYQLVLTVISKDKIDPSIAVPLKAFGGQINKKGNLIIKYNGTLK